MQIVRSTIAYFLSLLLFLPVAGSELSLHYCCGELYSIEWRRSQAGSPADACGMEDQMTLSGGGAACCTFATVAIQQSGVSSENHQTSVVSGKFLPVQAIAQPLHIHSYWASPDLFFPAFFSYSLTPALPIWLLVRVLRL